MDMKEFPAFVAENFGVRNINPLGAHFASTDDSYLASFHQAVDTAGSHVVDLGLGGRYFYDPDPAAAQAAVDYGRKWIDIAVKIGSPSVRQHLELRPSQKAQVATAAENLGRLADHAAKHNIVVNLENDNASAEDPFVLVAVIEKVKSPYLRALPDFGNSLIGHDREYNERAVKAMLGHAWNMCHVKDMVETEKGGLEKVDLGRMFDLSKQSSFLGYYSMEYEVDAGDPIAGTQKLVQRSLQYLG
jgi:sugar phosphate isomerase/epimerase